MSKGSFLTGIKRNIYPFERLFFFFTISLFFKLKVVYGQLKNDFSAPAAHFGLSAFVIANSAITPNSGYSSTFRSLYSALLNSILVTRLIRLELRLKFGNNARKLHPYYQLMDTKLPQNLLFLYSESDSVCVAKDIGAFHEEMREQKYNVQAKKWEDSEHVQHLKLHTEEYERLCTEFVEKSCSK